MQTQTDALPPGERLKGTLIVLVWVALALLLRGPHRPANRFRASGRVR
jgi:hypothetical protein